MTAGNGPLPGGFTKMPVNVRSASEYVKLVPVSVNVGCRDFGTCVPAAELVWTERSRASTGAAMENSSSASKLGMGFMFLLRPDRTSITGFAAAGARRRIALGV